MTPSSYPSSLDSASLFPTRTDATLTATEHAADHNNLADAVIKVETELGTDPSGSYSTVGERIAGLSRTGGIAARGSASSYPGGRYFATDQLAEYISDGSSWYRTSAPAGELVSFPGFNPPVSLVRAYGQAVSRTGVYADIYEAHTIALSGTGSSGDAVLTFSATPEGIGVGHKVEGTGINSAATVASVTSTTVTLTHNLTTDGARTVRFFPHGNGDGSTTFNLPDARGKVDPGRHTMGVYAGSPPTAVGSTLQTGSVIGATGGTVTHTLSSAESGVASHGHADSISFANPSFSLSAADHAHSYVKTDSYGVSNTSTSGGGYRVNGNPQTSVATSYSGALAVGGVIYQGAKSGGVTNHAGAAATSAHENRQPFIITDKCIRL